MAGIYLHIPFCKQACHYCDFHFSTSLANKAPFVDALLKEIELKREYLGGDTIKTIYFGGGTPSLLTGDELKRILDRLYQTYDVVSDAEITLEANPDDLNMQKIIELKSSPVNRLSIGIQSFRDQDLKMMNRAHNAQEADYSVKAAQDKGFENITIDLIYSIPQLSLMDWKENLHKAFALQVQHISAYSLTFEPKTVFGTYEKRGLMKPVEQELSSEQFLTMLQEMRANGFEQYEVSNFCKPGYESKHNSAYWSGEKYLGLGPSAHSFDGNSRQWNVANNSVYIRSLMEGKLSFEREELDARTQLNEYLMTGLRTRKGVDLQRIQSLFGVDLYKLYKDLLDELIHQGKVIIDGSRMALTDEGLLMADRIASDLFIIEE
ncbi:MAG TPA: radical SAM family heme chaperone HemW [Flavobacteriales bacterium]